MGVTQSESHGEGAQEAVAGNGSDDATREHPAYALTAPSSTSGDTPTAHSEAPTSNLLAGSVGDRCANCGAQLASDQHYCVQCGERRGASRFSTASMGAPPTRATTQTTTGPPPEPRRWSSATTLIAGIATLLIALGVGVLIGKTGNNSNSGKAAAPEVITVNGGGASTGATNGTTGAASTGSASTSGGTHHSARAHSAPPKTESAKAKAAATTSKPTKAAVKKASQAASGVTGGGAGQQQSTVTTGASCASGSAGCQNGHFSGNFFGQ